VYTQRRNAGLIVLLATLGGLALAAGRAGAQTAAPSRLPLTDSERLAKGEVRYGDAWVPIDNVFKDYQAALAEMQDLMQKAKTAAEGVAGIQYQLNQMKNENDASQQPTRNELAKSNAKRRELTKASETPEPRKPQLQPLPPKPKNYTANIRSTSNSRSSQDTYDRQMQDWQQEADAINKANDATMKKYQQDVAAWKKARDTAKAEIPKVDGQIKDLQQKLEQSNAALLTKQAPLLEKVKAANEEAQAIQRRISAAQTRLNELAAALTSAPENVRFQHGIVEWEGLFRTFADLDKELTETQAEVNRVKDQMRAEAVAAGRPFPPDWRHPQQDRLDALKVLLDKARAAGATATAAK
jgi:chromosome segregation ATPase